MPLSNGLDPQDWAAFRQIAHVMLDDMVDYLARQHEQPVWTQAPMATRQAIQEALPKAPSDLAAVHQVFKEHVMPYTAGNTRSGFMGWVQGGGTPVGMLAEMLAAGLNANLGGRDQMPILIEKQIVEWVRELFDFPNTASGLFVTGTSMANLLAVLIARRALLGEQVRHAGLAASGQRLTAYASEASHDCVAQAMDLSGIGRDALRRIAINARGEMDIAQLREAIAKDRLNGFLPCAVIATAGSVDTGAIDDLQAIAELTRAEKIWFHIDGAFGALGMLSPEIAPRLQGLQLADSVAFDFHKWGQVPYDAGFLIVRDGSMHHDTFAAPVAYLRRESRGLSAGSPWPCDLGPDLSRGFRALKTWFTLKVYGADKLGQIIAQTCELAQYLKRRIDNDSRLELLAPVGLNIVCFRFRCAAPEVVNPQIVVAVQESGMSVPSSTVVNGCFAIRAAIVNHRTTRRDIDALIEAVLSHGERLSALAHPGEGAP